MVSSCGIIVMIKKICCFLWIENMSHKIKEQDFFAGRLQGSIEPSLKKATKGRIRHERLYEGLVGYNRTHHSGCVGSIV